MKILPSSIFFFHLLSFDSFHILSHNIKCVMYSIQYEHHHNKKKALILQINKHFLCRCYWSKFIIICRTFHELSPLLCGLYSWFVNMCCTVNTNRIAWFIFIGKLVTRIHVWSVKKAYCGVGASWYWFR